MRLPRALRPAFAAALVIVGVMGGPGARPAAADHASASARRMSPVRGAAHQTAPRRDAGFAGTSTCAPIVNPPGSCGDLEFHGGPIMRSAQSYTIYWDPDGAMTASFKNAVNTFMGDLGSGTFYDSVLQYAGSNGSPQDAHTFAGTTVDTTPYPVGRPGTPGKPLLDSDIQVAVMRAINANPSWGPPGMTRAYHVLLPKDIYVSLDGNESFVDFCAYHNFFVSGSNPVLYSTLPYAATSPSGCGVGGTSPTGSADVDDSVSLASHELMEMVSDPLGNAWFDAYGNENGDLCAYVYGTRAADGGNVTLGDHRYALQLEWSNAADTNPPNYHAACVAGPFGGLVRRIAGQDRIATAVLGSRDVWGPAGGSGSQAQTAVIARSDDYPDALAGVPLAGADRGPLLLTTQSGLDSRVAGEVQRILASGSTVYVLGGTAALSPSVDSSLQSLGYQVVRLAGDDRYATAVAIATTGLHDPASVLLATGLGFADALGAGAAAAHIDGAVLLTAGSTMPDATANYLANHSSTRYAVGGPAAAAAPAATAIVGADRYDTATRVATRFFGSVAFVDVATGTAFPDALGGGAHAAVSGVPLLLTDPASLPSTVASYLDGQKGSITDVVVFGGTAAVSDNVLSQINSALTG